MVGIRSICVSWILLREDGGSEIVPVLERKSIDCTHVNDSTGERCK